MEEKTIIDFINTSFLTDDEKRTFIDLFEKEGATDSFYQALDAALAREVENRTTKALTATATISTGFDELSLELKQKKKALADALRLKIKAIPPTDLTSKDNLWDEYYLAIEDLNKKYLGKAQTVSSQAILQTVD